MANTNLFHLLVIALCFSHSITCSNAVPFTRIGRMVHRLHAHHQHQEINTETHLVASEESLKEQSMVERVVDVQVNDYPGSGANNRHTPRSQYGRCVDC